MCQQYGISVFVSQGAFHLVKISGISGSAVNGTRFVGSSHWKIPRKSGKFKKVGPFSRLEFPNGMSCSIYVSRSLYQFQVHCRAPRQTGVYDQMEKLFTNRKFHFCSHQNFRVFFLNGKRPQTSFHGKPVVASWNSILLTHQIWVVLLIGWSKFPMWHDQSEAQIWCVSSMEFLCLFLRRHFVEKAVASQI